MTTKASPPATTNPSTNSGVVKIKKELPSDEIKEFAETAMNELLGWYGYDGVDRLDLSSKTSRLLQSAASANHMEKARSRSRNGLSDSRLSQRGGDSTTSDHDTHSSREDSKSPNSGKAIDEKPDYNNCVWCRKPVADNSTDFLTTADGPRYCSESCFTQSRRASFKKAKTCDWCRHVRHAVSYVDFQDGASQLQFCSDKCLNQYKMQIFCKETQAHLDMNPHLCDKGLETASGSGSLITPDLWLRNCRSRSASPASTVSVSPTPVTPTPQVVPAQPHKPLISVAPVSKLMSKSPGIMNNRQSPKHSRKKRPSRAGTASVGPQNSNSNKTNNSINNNNNNNNNNINNMNKSKILANSLAASPKLPPKPFPSVQDFQNISAQPISPIDGPPQPPLQHSAVRPPVLPSVFFPSPAFPPRPPFMPQPHPRFYGGLQHLFTPPDVVSGLLGGPPPVTVIVPYPIIIPLPIPIPIPLPIMDFVKAAEKKEQSMVPPEEPTKTDSKSSELSDEPLDFTKSKDEGPTLIEHPPEARTLPSPTSNEHSVINSEDHRDESSKEEKLPKLKITRLHSKRLVTASTSSTASSYTTATTNATTTTTTTAASKEAQISPSECSRPLRKRKRIIDCDFQRMTSKEIDVEDTTPSASGNKQRK